MNDHTIAETANLATIEALYRAFRANDYEAFAALCHDDLEWHQAPGFPDGGTHHGAAEVIENVFQAFSRNWAEWRFERSEIIATASRVVVLGAYHGTHGETGRAFTSETAHVYDLDNGRIRRFRQYADTWVIHAVMRPEPMA